MHDNDQITGTSSAKRGLRSWTALGLAAAGVAALTAAAPGVSSAAGQSRQHADFRHRQPPAIKLVALNPKAGDVAGTGGDFTVDLQLLAQNARGNRQLSAANGYRPGLNLPPAATFGPGLPDPDAPGLVVTLSTTPAGAGGPNANLAGVFQLNSVTRRQGLMRVLNTWEVGSPGFFGKNRRATMTAFVVRGTAPGMVTGRERPISNVVKETFTIGG